MEIPNNDTFKVALISMPWSIFNRPSVQLGTLKAFVERDTTIQVDTFHPYLNAAQSIGIDTYNYIARKTWAGEALYSPLVFPEMRQQAEKLFYKRCSDRINRLDYKKLSETLEQSLTEWLDSLDLSKFDLIGLSISFSQLFSTLAVAAKIKKMRKDLPIVVGGSSCASELGTSLLLHFPQLDYVIDGEGEKPLLQLCHYLVGQTLHLPLQVKSREAQTDAISCESVKDLNELPIPDYQPYFQELQRLFPGVPFFPVIPLEFSRGCWWGKCSFCNLNIQWKGFRWKDCHRMLLEINHLVKTYQCLDFSFTDNALPPRETDRLFQVLASKNYDLRFFAEIRAITDRDKISLYRSGGLTRVQVGIESFSTSLLEKLVKGTSVIENIAAMKFCAENNIELDGNVITQFPTSTEEEVEETLRHLDYVLPFHPLSSATFFLGMGSPVDCNPKKYGLHAITQHAHNRKLFPSHLLKSMKLITKDYRGERIYQREIWKKVNDHIKKWRNFHQKREEQTYPPLCYRDGDGFLIIRQEIISGKTLLHRLEGRSRELYLFCTIIKSLDEIQQEFVTLPKKTILNFFDDLSKKHLLFQEGNRFLALAICSSSPK